jgi:hypothetical protein
MQVAVCLASHLVVSATLQAQQSTATVIGTVKDASGGVVPDATVTLTNLGTGAQSTVATGASGEYTIADLAVGNYSLSISKPGFKSTTFDSFQLQVGQSARMDATLEVGASTQKVTVAVTVPLINTLTSDVGQVVSREELENIPLNGRAFWQLTQLTPGALYTPGGSSPYTGSSAIRSTSVTVSVNSGNTDMTGYELDGANITEVQLGSTLVQPDVDAIQEFKVEGGNTNAQFGHTPTVVTSVIKSGTNQFHGDAFEFLRNDILDARNTFYQPSPGDPYKKDILKRNQFGGTFGGPIKRDKAFFFADLEATRVRQAVVSSSIVPSETERQGDFSQELPTPLLNPYNGYQPFPGNVITPSSLIVSQAQFFNNYLPAPNLVQGTTSWFVAGTPLLLNEYKGDAKVDENITARDHFMARYSVNNYEKSQSDQYPTLGLLQDNSRGQDFTLAYKIAQRATVEVLNTIYETDFLGFSYGFRPERSPHHALDALYTGLLTGKVNWVLDLDLKGFFDGLSHGWLVKFVEHRIADRRGARLIQKWLNAGVLEDGKHLRVEEGTPQGGSATA